MRLSSCFSCLVIFVLSGCELQNIKPSGDISEIIEVEKRAAVAYQNEDWQAAEREYLYLAKNVPSQPDPWFRLGNIYARTNRLDAAVAAYRNALIRDSKNSKIWHNLGIVQLRLATNTFIEMLQYTNEDDPLYTRATNVINSVGDLMAAGFETQADK